MEDIDDPKIRRGRVAPQFEPGRTPASSYGMFSERQERMLTWLTYLVYSFFHGYGAILLVLGTIFGFFFTFVIGRMSSPIWMMAIVMKFPTLQYLISLNADYGLLMMLLVIGYGLGGLGFGWLLGIFLCWIFWQFNKRNVDATKP
jgi:hypothetical protein